MDADIFVSGKKKLRIQKYPDTFGRGYIENTIAITTIKEEPNIVFTAVLFVLLVLGRLFIGIVPFLPRDTLQMGLNLHANSYISC